MANGRSWLKINISPLPVTDNLENRLFKGAKMSQRIETRFLEATIMHSKNQRKKLTDMLTVLTKKVTLQVRSKTPSNKPNKKKNEPPQTRILQQV